MSRFLRTKHNSAPGAFVLACVEDLQAHSFSLGMSFSVKSELPYPEPSGEPQLLGQ